MIEVLLGLRQLMFLMYLDFDVQPFKNIQQRLEDFYAIVSNILNNFGNCGVTNGLICDPTY